MSSRVRVKEPGTRHEAMSEQGLCLSGFLSHRVLSWSWRYKEGSVRNLEKPEVDAEPRGAAWSLDPSCGRLGADCCTTK